MDHVKHEWIPIHFDEQEIEDIKRVGAARLGVKMASGMSMQKIQHEYQMGVKGQIMSYAAERALCKLFDAPIQGEATVRGNKGRHARIEPRTSYDPMWANAAWVSDPTYDLKFLPNKVPEAQFFTLWCGTLSNGLYGIGGISRSRFDKIKTVEDYGYGIRVAVDQAALSPLADITTRLGFSARVRSLRERSRQVFEEQKKAHGNLFAGLEMKHNDQ